MSATAPLRCAAAASFRCACCRKDGATALRSASRAGITTRLLSSALLRPPPAKRARRNPLRCAHRPNNTAAALHSSAPLFSFPLLADGFLRNLPTISVPWLNFIATVTEIVCRQLHRKPRFATLTITVRYAHRRSPVIHHPPEVAHNGGWFSQKRQP